MKYIKLFYLIMYSIYTNYSCQWALTVAVSILSVQLQLGHMGELVTILL